MTAKLIETGFYDVRGIPICVGDRIRVKHFTHYRRKQQMWLYFRVHKTEKNGRLVVQNCNDQAPEKHQCLLEHCGVETAEVLDGDTEWHQGNGIMWCERPRRK